MMKIIDKKSVLLDFDEFEEYERLTEKLEAYQYLDEVFEQVEDELFVELAEERTKSDYRSIALEEIKKKYGVSDK